MDIVLASARYGIELVDALTGGPVIGSSDVRLTSSDAPILRFESVRSRWVFERLDAGDATFSLAANQYVPRRFVASSAIGSDGPPVPAAGVAPELQFATMNPATGYPFPASLTRIVGVIYYRLAAPDVPLVAIGAKVTLTPKYPSTTLPTSYWSGADVVTFTTDDGQYTMWFLPSSPPSGYAKLPSRCDVAVVFDPPTPPPLSATLVDQDMTAFRLTSIPTIVLGP